MPVNSCTVAYPNLVNVLISDSHIGPAFNPATIPPELFNPEKIGAKKFIAIWDTGASGTIITKKVVNDCGLKPIGMTVLQTANESRQSLVYLVSIALPSKVVIPELRVSEASISGGADILIGMDIIGRGDFAITNKDGKTTFSFRIPSLECIDFVKQGTLKQQPLRSIPQVGRNDPCPCGSGRKYKKCCGKRV